MVSRMLQMDTRALRLELHAVVVVIMMVMVECAQCRAAKRVAGTRGHDRRKQCVGVVEVEVPERKVVVVRRNGRKRG